jgi:transposase
MIVFDKFYVVKHLRDAVDRVRRGEHRALRRANDERLTGSKSLWLRRPAELADEQRAAWHALQQEDLKVGRRLGAHGALPPPLGVPLRRGGARRFLHR